MMENRASWEAILRANAGEYARVALQNITREFPAAVSHTMQSPGDFPHRPRERTPVFYGSFDWHSCVEMHWLLVRLLRVAGDHFQELETRTALEAQFTAEGLAAEAQFIGLPTNGTRERPYGWGWALRLVHELLIWEDPDAQRWTWRFVPLAETLTRSFLSWLPKATYPMRYGVHSNSAFGLSLALPYARARSQAGDSMLLEAMTAAAHRWYAA